jgi:hypothetical protein
MNPKCSIYWLICVAVALPIMAQPTPNDAGQPAAVHPGVAQHSCTTVAITSDTPALPYRLAAPYFERRADFQEAKLVLSEQPAEADAVVQLSQANNGATRILVTNRHNGQKASRLSGWTNYPGMVAADAMEQLKTVCAEVDAGSAPPPVTVPCGDVTLLRPGRSLAACSHTSWMDNREIYQALKSRDELTEHSVQLLPACGGAGTMLDIEHNLDRTAEWNWKLRTAQGQTVSEGMVIASSSRSAAARIAEDALHDVPYEPANQQPASANQCFTPSELEAFLHPRPDRSFKHVTGRVAYHTGQGLAAAAIISAYAAGLAAMGIAMGVGY